MHVFKEREMGMENQKIDQKLKKMARQSGPPMPKEYEEQLEQLLQTLPGKQRRKIPGYWKAAAAMLAVALLFGSSGIEGAIHYLNARMGAMTDTEISDYNDMVQSIPLNADSFSRAFSKEERERMLELREEYLLAGRYPDGELLTVEHAAEAPDDVVSYIVDSSAYFLPERELSDEELLELLDFDYKRDYSVAQSNRGNSTDGRETTVDDAVKKVAAEAVRVALGVDVSEMYCRAEAVSDGDSYCLVYEEDAVKECCVVVQAETNRVTSVAKNLAAGEREGVEFSEKELENGKKQFEKCLACDIWGEIDVEQITAKYYLQNDGQNVNMGCIYYLAELSDGSAYSCTYDMLSQQIRMVEYYGANSDSIRDWNTPLTIWSERKQLTYKIVTMK